MKEKNELQMRKGNYLGERKKVKEDEEEENKKREKTN